MGLFSSDDKDIYAIAPIPERLQKKERIAILTGDKTEDLEFFYPYYRLSEEGFAVDVITPDGGSFEAKHGMGLKATRSIDQVKPEDYDLLYLPGGKAPAELRKDDRVLNFVRQFAATGKPIAAICHGPQILISAGLVGGRTMTAQEDVRKEIAEAGGIAVDEALKIDGQFITSRLPGDLHRHLSGVINTLYGRDKDWMTQAA